MLSYHHAYHAGNFADVLKHSISLHILNYLTQKPKPVFYLDTHSGTGAYALATREPQKNKEFENGIAQFWSSDTLPEMLSHYVSQIQTFNETDALTHYPGSPWLAQQVLRPQDRLALYELHPQAFKDLKNNFNHDKRIQMHQSDGFHACISQLPPKERRGYILMDPPYEIKQDYQTVVETLQKAYKKFATGVYALWYPVVDRYRINTLLKQFENSAIHNVVQFEMGIAPDGDNGMTASGMIVINPPWTLMAAAKDALPVMAKQLGGEKGFYRIKQVTPE